MFIIKKKFVIINILVFFSLCLIGCRKKDAINDEKDNVKITTSFTNEDFESVPEKVIMRENSENGLTNNDALEKELIVLKNKIDKKEFFKLKIVTDTFEGEKQFEQLFYNGNTLEYTKYINDKYSGKDTNYIEKVFSGVKIIEKDKMKTFYLISSDDKKEEFFSIATQ